MQRTAARRRRLSRLPSRTSAWLPAARGCRIPAAERRIPAFAGLNVAQLDWHLNQLRVRYHLRNCVSALERLDDLQSMLGNQTIDSILAFGLSPFLDAVQREVAALHADIMTISAAAELPQCGIAAGSLDRDDHMPIASARPEPGR